MKNQPNSMTDHLGNVRAVVGYDATGNNPILVRQKADYYPFGWKHQDSQVSSGETYRYGYQGEFAEEDEETGWNQFELRMWDGRIGRWMTTDPYRQHFSPYMGMSNRPNMNVDSDGGYDCPTPPCNGYSEDSAREIEPITITSHNLDINSLFDFNSFDLGWMDEVERRRREVQDWSNNVLNRVKKLSDDHLVYGATGELSLGLQFALYGKGGSGLGFGYSQDFLEAGIEKRAYSTNYLETTLENPWHSIDKSEFYGEIGAGGVSGSIELRDVHTYREPEKGMELDFLRDMYPEEYNREVQVLFFAYERVETIHSKQKHFVGLKIGGRAAVFLGANGEAKIGIGW